MLDEVDRKILEQLSVNARATVKEIAAAVSLTSPAVSERIRKLEAGGVIEGYTVRYNPELTRNHINAMVSIQVAPKDRPEFGKMLKEQPAVRQCYQVTGTYSHMVQVQCRDITALEKLLSLLQKHGQTNTQIILAVMEGLGLDF